jgi:hypothetical protein
VHVFAAERDRRRLRPIIQGDTVRVRFELQHPGPVETQQGRVNILAGQIAQLVAEPGQG